MMANRLINLRHTLHQQPEASGNENETSQLIIEELNKMQPAFMIENLGGFGILARFEPEGKIKQRILLRAELDAIAVNEETNLDYSSKSEGVMHGCGHDGHMTILIGVAEALQKNKLLNTEVSLLFQPAEETGEGAVEVLKDERFQELTFDHGYALHNLPGFEEGTVIVRDGVFASASVGVEISIKGKSSHAAFPEKGVNPSKCLTELMSNFLERFEMIGRKDETTKAVITYIRMGERAFGISPGSAKFGFTVRSSDDNLIDQEIEWYRKKIDVVRESFDGKIEMNLVEPFVSTINSVEGNRILSEAARTNGMKIEKLKTPFPWSEDFGSFREKFPITLFGLGAGLKHAPLHSEMYDFNDRLIMKGVELFTSIISLIDKD